MFPFLELFKSDNALQSSRALKPGSNIPDFRCVPHAFTLRISVSFLPSPSHLQLLTSLQLVSSLCHHYNELTDRRPVFLGHSLTVTEQTPLTSTRPALPTPSLSPALCPHRTRSWCPCQWAKLEEGDTVPVMCTPTTITRVATGGTVTARRGIRRRARRCRQLRLAW